MSLLNHYSCQLWKHDKLLSIEFVQLGIAVYSVFYIGLVLLLISICIMSSDSSNELILFKTHFSLGKKKNVHNYRKIKSVITPC